MYLGPRIAIPRKTNKNIINAIYSNLGLITFYLYSTSFIMYIIDYNDAIIKCVEYQNNTSISSISYGTRLSDILKFTVFMHFCNDLI